MVQQQAWMAYPCSAHFSDKFSYIKYFISNYHLKVISRLSFSYLEIDKHVLFNWGRTRKTFSAGGGTPDLFTNMQGVLMKNIRARGCGLADKKAQGVFCKM
jgi:hypothetical protein